MDMADEVFRNDAYLSEFEAGVVSVNGDEVVLDCTGFYPGGGGQVCDTGTVNGVPVSDVRYKGDEIIHVIPGNGLKPGQRVWCSIDWDRRFDLMMGHTAEHLLFCSLHRLDPELEVVKISISPEDKYVVLNHDVPWSLVGEAVRYANDRIADNLPVRKTVMDRNDPDMSKVRIKLERIPEGAEITVVNIGDIDYSACSGIHVMETSEIEMIFVDRKVSQGKTGTAVHFKVGKAARDAAAELAVTCLQVIDECASKPEDIIRTVGNMKKEIQIAAEASKQASKRALAEIAPAEVKGTRFYTGVFPGADRKLMAETAEKHAAEGAVCILISTADTASAVVSSGTAAVDARNVLSKGLEAFGGRGGGRPGMAQGGFPDVSRADEALRTMIDIATAQLRSAVPSDADVHRRT